MTTGRTIGLTAAALIACGSVASASTITQTASASGATFPTALKTTFDFNQFNPALGTLTGVTDTLTESLTGTLTVKNLNLGHSSSFSTSITDTATKTVTGTGLSLSTVTFTNNPSGSLAAGASMSFSVSGSSSFTESALSLTGFIGTGTLSAPATDAGTCCNAGSGTFSFSFIDSGTITDKLVYTYTATSVPEPGTLALLGGALAGLGFFRRRKRRA